MMDKCVGVQELVSNVDKAETLILTQRKGARKVVDGLQSAITKPVSAQNVYGKKNWTFKTWRDVLG